MSYSCPIHEHLQNYPLASSPPDETRSLKGLVGKLYRGVKMAMPMIQEL